MADRQHVVLIGASTRATYAFAEPLLREYASTHEIVGCFDINPERIRVMSEHLQCRIPAFSDFDRMVAETRPNLAIITTMDCTHVDYIEKALAHGLGFLCDKPLCTDASQCRRILAALAKFSPTMAVAGHNCRYVPAMMKMKELIDSGKIGRVHSVVLNMRLGREHGTSYFRRWNGRQRYSGGLLIHKASHQFDLIDWLIQSKPVKVAALGGQAVFGPRNSPFRGERCGTCQHSAQCKFYMNISDHQNLRSRLAWAAAQRSQAFTTDLCVFGEDADSIDRATVGIEYANGVCATFDLNAFPGVAGEDLRVEGSLGTLEHRIRYGQGSDAQVQDGSAPTTTDTLQYVSPAIVVQDIPVPVVEGGHGGADPVMLAELFGLRPPSIARATLDEAIQAVLIGDAANRSIRDGRTVDVQ